MSTQCGTSMMSRRCVWAAPGDAAEHGHRVANLPDDACRCRHERLTCISMRRRASDPAEGRHLPLSGPHKEEFRGLRMLDYGCPALHD